MTDTQLHYEISLYFMGEKIKDVNHFTFFRAPMYKMASYCITKCFISQLLALELSHKISLNTTPEIDVEIRMIDESSIFSEKEIKRLYNQKLLCINIFPERPLRYVENNLHVELVLVHPILYYMGTTNSFNTIIENTTAYNTLKDFESWISSKYGDVFDFQHYAPGTNINKFIYEHILVKSDNDLNVPTYLIDTYKINNNPCFYFFDNFNISSKAKNEICAYYFNLSNLNVLTSQKISDYPDMNMLTKTIREYSIPDVLKNYDKLNTSMIYETREIKYDHKKITSSQLPNKRGKIEKINIAEGRDANIPQSGSLSQRTLSQSNRMSRIYVPDDCGNAKQRYEKTKDQVINYLKQFVFIEITNALPNYPQFGFKYDITGEGKFIFAPLVIFNMFVRKNNKESFLKLINKSMFIKFSDKQQGG